MPPDAPRAALLRKITPTGLTLRNASLGNCIDTAWGLEHDRVVGPAWRDRPTDVLFDIEAKISEPQPESAIRKMLQQLLMARLGLAVHIEQRTLPIYELYRAKAVRG
jgi:uncharacterized protein (TIGR03435 family)